MNRVVRSGAMTTNAVLSAIRRALWRRRYIEFLGPCISSELPIGARSSIKISAANFNGYLLPGENYSATQLSCDHPFVFAIRPLFRAEIDPKANHLIQFHYLQAIAQSNQARISSLLINILRTAAAALDNEEASVGTREAIEFIHRNPKSISYASACDALGVTLGTDLSLNHHLALVRKLGSPVFLIEKPFCAEPYYFHYRMRPVSTSFDLLLPFCGEVASGGELESTRAVLLEQYESSAYKADQVRLGEKAPEQKIQPYLDAITSRPGRVMYGISVERLLQFFLAKTAISDATLFPAGYDTQGSPILQRRHSTMT